MKDPKWLKERQILAIHDCLIAEHGGLSGVRDSGLLSSALERPRHLFAYQKPTIFEMAAAYAYGIARNHPFLDGNKRTALTAAGVFLELNGYQLTATEQHAVMFTLTLAEGTLGQEEFAQWLKSESRPLAM